MVVSCRIFTVGSSKLPLGHQRAAGERQRSNGRRRNASSARGRGESCEEPVVDLKKTATDHVRAERLHGELEFLYKAIDSYITEFFSIKLNRNIYIFFFVLKRQKIFSIFSLRKFIDSCFYICNAMIFQDKTKFE